MTPSDSAPKGRGGRFDSLNAVDLVIEADDSDKNFTPPSPALLRLLEAEREKLRRWGALKDPAAEQPPAEEAGNDSGGA